MEDEVELKPMDGCQGDSTEERLRLTQEVRWFSETEFVCLNIYSVN